MHIPLVHPSTILVAGPTGSGKTVFVRKLITENMIYPFPTRIVIVFSEWQKEYEMLKWQLPSIEFLKGPVSPELYESFKPSEPNMLVLDDQMTESSNTGEIEKYFVQGAHHRNLTVVFIVQNLFSKNKALRTSSLNSNYFVIYKNPRDKQQMSILSRQMYPNSWRALIAALTDATEEPYSYMLLDMRPETPEEYRIRGNIFPSDPTVSTTIYII